MIYLWIYLVGVLLAIIYFIHPTIVDYKLEKYLIILNTGFRATKLEKCKLMLIEVSKLLVVSSLSWFSFLLGISYNIKYLIKENKKEEEG